jgi:hypothetical protein
MKHHQTLLFCLLLFYPARHNEKVEKAEGREFCSIVYGNKYLLWIVKGSTI